MTPPVLPSLDDARETKLRELAQRATPGPWAYDESGVWGMIADGSLGPVLGGRGATTENMAFVAACSPGVIVALLDELTSLRASQEEGARDTKRLDWLAATASVDAETVRFFYWRRREDAAQRSAELREAIDFAEREMEYKADRVASLPSVEVGT